MANPFKDTKNEVKPHVKPIVPEPVEEVAAVAPTPPAPKKEKKKNPLAGLIEAKSGGKSYALYLDTDLVEEIDRLAKENKTNRSKIVNILLRKEIFGE